MKTYDSKTPERWERISEAVPGRSKKDCMKRWAGPIICSHTLVWIHLYFAYSIYILHTPFIFWLLCRYKELAEIVKAKKAAALAAAKKS